MILNHVGSNSPEFIMDKEYNHKIMFVKMDSSNVDGVFKVDGYIDNTYTAQETARLIKERLEVTKRKNSNSWNKPAVTV